MKALLNRIHARVGDLWWYSAMIFVACRTGDVINAFIGLWLVPKYVGSEELGAVLPLQQLTTFLTVPLGVVAVVFAKYVNTYAARGEYGKVKSFIRDVLGLSSVLFVVCIAGAYLVMPFFYERLRIQSGLLTVLILASGFVTALMTLVNSTQQGLKRFKTMSLMNIIGAPVRLVTMLLAMPVRALSGYMLGQTTPSAVTTALSALDTHRTLKPYAPDTSWRKDWREILNYTWPIAIYTAFGLLFGTITTTVYRQRLPEIESAAHYMLSRFSEISGYVGCAVTVVLFPLASEASERNSDGRHLLKQCTLMSVSSTLAFVIFFASFGKLILSSCDTWQTYQAFAYLLPFMAANTSLCAGINSIVMFDAAKRKFASMFSTLAISVGWSVVFVVFTGCEIFRGMLPGAIVDFMNSFQLNTLKYATYYGLLFTLIQIGAIVVIHKDDFRRQKANGPSPTSMSAGGRD